jgi:hypothetical protein
MSDDSPQYIDTLSNLYQSPDSPENWQTTPDTPEIHNQEAREMANNEQPELIVLGVLNGAKVVKGNWPNGTTATLSDRTLAALEKLGLGVHDEPSNYVF